ncbi:YlqF/YawG family GTPase [Candidatus Harpocratesius sp.]
MRTEKHWKEIFNTVIQETDIILEVLDARNPLGTHNRMIEDFVKQNRPEIEIYLIMNKADIIPKSVMQEWKWFFKTQGYKIFAVSARFNRGIIELEKYFRKTVIRPNTNILIVGYPNTGKSSLIEALTRGKKKVGVSNRAGYTRVIKKIKLTNKIYLIDTPGVIPIDETNEMEMAIKSCMIADKLEDPLAVVESIYSLITREQFERTYKIQLKDDDGIDELIEKIGKRYGRLKSGGRVNEVEVQKLIIRDWQNNKLHYYTLPPSYHQK